MNACRSERGSKKLLKGEPAGLDKKVKYHKGMRRVKPIISGNASDGFCLHPSSWLLQNDKAASLELQELSYLTNGASTLLQ